MIDRRGSEDGEPKRQKAGGFLRARPVQSAVELHRFEEAKPMTGKGGQVLEAICDRSFVQCRPQLRAKIARRR